MQGMGQYIIQSMVRISSLRKTLLEGIGCRQAISEQHQETARSYELYKASGL